MQYIYGMCPCLRVMHAKTGCSEFKRILLGMLLVMHLKLAV